MLNVRLKEIVAESECLRILGLNVLLCNILYKLYMYKEETRINNEIKNLNYDSKRAFQRMKQILQKTMEIIIG